MQWELQRKEKIFSIYYANKTFNEAQENYSTIEKEMMAMVFACDKFKPYILGSHVIIHRSYNNQVPNGKERCQTKVNQMGLIVERI